MQQKPPSPILVVPYDPRWPKAFESAAREIRPALGSNLVALHHIGSTSVPGLHAKPVIDLLAAVTELDQLDRCSAAMKALGYETMGEFGIAGRRYFRRDDAAGRRTHQVHAFVDGSDHLMRHLAFRDYLRAHPAIAAEYGQLKQSLAAAHPHDMQAYMDGKDGFIQQTQRLAIAWMHRSS